MPSSTKDKVVPRRTRARSPTGGPSPPQSLLRLTSSFRVPDYVAECGSGCISDGLRNRIRGLVCLKQHRPGVHYVVRRAEETVARMGTVAARMRQLALRDDAERLSDRDHQVLGTQLQQLLAQLHRLASSVSPVDQQLVSNAQELFDRGVRSHSSAFDAAEQMLKMPPLQLPDGFRRALDISPTTWPQTMRFDGATRIDSERHAVIHAVAMRLQREVARTQVLMTNVKAAKNTLVELDAAEQHSALVGSSRLRLAAAVQLASASRSPPVSVTGLN